MSLNMSRPEVLPHPNPSLLSKRKNVKKVLAPKCPNISRKFGPNPFTSFLIKMGTTYSTTTNTTKGGGRKVFYIRKKALFYCSNIP